jgi:SEC-C motif-containing protein
MRSRYAAFVRGEVEYLVRTLHADHEDRAMAVKELEARLRAHGKRARYARLEVLDHDAPDADGVAHVLFRVTMRLDGKDASFAELSSFAHDGEGWRYVGGRTYPPNKAPARIADAST